MFKFKVNKGLQLNNDNSKPHEDYYTFSKVMSFGFPNKPSALAWDPILSLMAIGTQTGGIRVYGAPGVCFINQHKEQINIVELIFIPGKGRVISWCSDNSLHLWEFNTVNNKCTFAEVKSFVLGGLMKRLTCIFLSSRSDILYLGTMCGNIYTLEVETFEMAESAIYQDVVLQNVPDNVKLSQGCVRVICEQPGGSDSVLVGYQQGLMALWNTKSLVVVSFFVATQSLESITWHRKGNRFISSHSDGSYITWSTEDPSKPIEVPMTPYGPFSCKAIHRILWRSVKGGDDFIIFNGGMSRAIHGEKSTVSIMCGEKHQVLDLSSNVINFFTISDSTKDSDFDNPHSLIILLEEELVALDLESEDWLPFCLPYLDIPHSSPVTCAQFCPELNTAVSRLFMDICQTVGKEGYSETEWPVKGGKSDHDQSLVQSLLVTGHENGCVKFWNVSSGYMQLLYSFQTAQTFVTYDKCDEAEELEDWPPFRKIGTFDSLTDDSRLAIRKIVFNDLSKTLVVGGTAGQILVMTLAECEVERDVKSTVVHLVSEYNAAVFGVHAPLMVRCGVKTYGKGFHLLSLIQLTPPAAISALTFHAEWNIFAAGTSHGFLLFDITQRKCIISKSTLGIRDSFPPDFPSDDVFARSQTLKRSLRESFKKLRSRTSFSKGRERAGSLSSELMKDMSRDDTLKRESFTSTPDPTGANSPSPELRSFASDTDSQRSDSILNSTVKCVYLAQSFIINNVITTPTFWAGTSDGFIYLYTIAIPAAECRVTSAITCQLGKEIQLKHRAPVISIQIVDHRGYALPDPLEVLHNRVKPADLGRSHRVVICTEEQIKVFSLPSMKTQCKYKMNVVDRCHANQVTFASFQSKTESKSIENSAVCFTNTNEIAAFSMPDLKKRISFHCTSTDDSSIPLSFMPTHNGCFIYIISPSEFEMCSLSSASSPFAQSRCSIEIPEGARDIKKVEDSTIVLQVHDIARENANDSETNENQVIIATENALNCDEGDKDKNQVHRNDIEISEPQTSRQQYKRAPLARIEELNISDEHRSAGEHSKMSC